MILLKNIQSLEVVKEYFSSIEDQEFGFKTPFFSTKGYVHRQLKVKIFEYPQTPIDIIFNRMVINDPHSIDYFSVTLEPQRKTNFKLFKQRPKFKESWYPPKDKFNENDFVVNEQLNYDSVFYSINDPIHFLSEWLCTVFSDDTITNFCNGNKINDKLSEYKNRFSLPGADTWESSKDILRIVEERNDIRIIVVINPFDLHPELSITSLEDKGIVTPVMSLIYDWFKYSNLLKVDGKYNLSMSEEARFKSYPTVSNNEQIIKLDATPFFTYGLSAQELLLKGSRRQTKFYKNYFKQLLDIYPNDAFGKTDFEGAEAVTLEFSGKKIKYFHGRRSYFKPEFDLFILFYPVKTNNRNGDDYFEFNFEIRYRPFIKSREEKVDWTDHHALEDLGK